MSVKLFGMAALTVLLTACSERREENPGGDRPAEGGGNTAAPTAFRCGDETFTVVFEESRALVTVPDGSVVTLERLTTPDQTGASRSYTDGRLLFVQESESRVLFARGRMMPSPCANAG